MRINGYVHAGVHAFQKYESGAVMTSRAMTNLLLAMFKHPKDLERIREDVRRSEREPERDHA